MANKKKITYINRQILLLRKTQSIGIRKNLKMQLLV